MSLQGLLVCKLAPRGTGPLQDPALSFWARHPPTGASWACFTGSVTRELLEGATQGALLGADVELEQCALHAGQSQEKATSFELSFGTLWGACPPRGTWRGPEMGASPHTLW